MQEMKSKLKEIRKSRSQNSIKSSQEELYNRYIHTFQAQWQAAKVKKLGVLKEVMTPRRFLGKKLLFGSLCFRLKVTQ